jgi:hypothetical protein
MTDADLAAGKVALLAYVQQIEGWEAAFVPDSAITDGATQIINALDQSGSAPTPDAQAIVADTAAAALYQSITDAGYGDYVTSDQCVTAAQAVIAAVTAERQGATS